MEAGQYYDGNASVSLFEEAWTNNKGANNTEGGSVAAKIGSPLESDLSMYFLQLQKGLTDLFKGFPGNT